MSYPVMPLGFLGSQGDNDTYRIERSLRFNSADSAYLSRTPASAGNRKTWTWSGWAKRSNLGGSVSPTLFSAGTGLSYCGLFLSSSDTLIFNHRDSGANQALLDTTQVFRDVSSWYHFVVSVDTTQSTASDRIKLYVNGSQITTFSTATYFTQNYDNLRVNTTSAHYVGFLPDSNYFNGYLTEINFIDGQALTPSSFGETDPITGRWKAKRYAGTYGTNGFYLNFADNSATTSTTLGKDLSGNGNNWTPNNFSVTAGAGNDSLVDSPTNYGIDTGVGGNVVGNYAVLNPNDLNAPNNNASVTLSNGNLDGTLTNGANRALSTIGVLSGKWYAEIAITSITGGVGQAGVLVGYIGGAGNGAGGGAGMVQYQATGNRRVDTGSAVAYGASYTTNDIIGIALDMDSSQVTFYKNNSSQGAISLTSTGQPYGIGFNWNIVTGQTVAITANFGQRPFAYTAPTGFKALCTTNLPTPTIQKPSKYMDVVTYTGNGSTQTISSLGFSPDLAWIKSRSGAANHGLHDTVRVISGDEAVLYSNTTDSESIAGSYLSSFNSNGFTLNANSSGNGNGSTYVAWAWDEAPIAGMDIVAFTNPASGSASFSHTLGVKPSMIITKARNATGNWTVTHKSLGANMQDYYLLLNDTSASTTSSGIWGGEPTSSLFYCSASLQVPSATMIAYLFAEVEGFSKFGSYTGNGSADGAFVWCGFGPRWIMYKDASSVNPWVVMDTTRQTFNVVGSYLLPNASDAESSTTILDIVSSGFKVRVAGASVNTSGNTIIFAAFAESPFKYARAR